MVKEKQTTVCKSQRRARILKHRGLSPAQKSLVLYGRGTIFLLFQGKITKRCELLHCLKAVVRVQKDS